MDRSANWPHDGHRGKMLRVGRSVAMVAANTGDELTLAPVRPDAFSAWSGDIPPPGCGYELAAAPKRRAGITIDAPFDSATIRGNRIWDNHDHQTQTHGLWITDRGSCVGSRVEDNDLAGNADEGMRAGHPAGGRTLAGQPRRQRLDLSDHPAGQPGNGPARAGGRWS